MESYVPKEKVPELAFAHLAPDVWKALGELERTGWVNRKVKNPETVQEHIISLRNLAHSLEGLSAEEKDELLDMLEVHDWPEAIHGDEVIINYDEEIRKKLKAVKFEKEQEVMAAICSKLGEQGKKIFALWLRFETADDKAAVFGRQLDKYQAVEKSLEYEKVQGMPLFKEFFDYAQKSITHPILVQRMEKLNAEWMLLNKEK